MIIKTIQNLKGDKCYEKVDFQNITRSDIVRGSNRGSGRVQEKNENNNPLKNTEWKLITFVDVGNNTKKTPEPDSEKCYTLKFLENGDSLTTTSSTNNFIGTYTIDIKTSSISITSLGGTKINEIYDGILYVESLIKVNKYTIDKDVLKLYYNDNKNYLEFKRR